MTKDILFRIAEAHESAKTSRITPTTIYLGTDQRREFVSHPAILEVLRCTGTKPSLCMYGSPMEYEGLKVLHVLGDAQHFRVA